MNTEERDPNFKQLVSAKGYTPYSLARESNVSENTIREMWRAETRDRRQFEVKKAIADELGVDLEVVQSAIDQTRQEVNNDE